MHTHTNTQTNTHTHAHAHAHTHTHTHQFPDKSNFKKLGEHWPQAGMPGFTIIIILHSQIVIFSDTQLLYLSKFIKV